MVVGLDVRNVVSSQAIQGDTSNGGDVSNERGN